MANYVQAEPLYCENHNEMHKYTVGNFSNAKAGHAYSNHCAVVVKIDVKETGWEGLS